MARPYRRVVEACEKLRRCSGILAAVNHADESSAWQALGRLDVIIMDVLELLQADRVVEPSEAFVEGYDALAARSEPLPFPEV